jgi:hypothetical protein
MTKLTTRQKTILVPIKRLSYRILNHGPVDMFVTRVLLTTRSANSKLAGEKPGLIMRVQRFSRFVPRVRVRLTVVGSCCTLVRIHHQDQDLSTRVFSSSLVTA